MYSGVERLSGWPYFWGYSNVPLRIRTATGFRSLASTSQPRRRPSRGMAPPPAKGSSSLGGLPSLQWRMRWRARSNSSDPVRPLPPSVFGRTTFSGWRTASQFARSATSFSSASRSASLSGSSTSRGVEEGPARRQGPPRPPDVQRRDVPVPDVLLAPGVRRDLLQGEGHLDEAFTAYFGHLAQYSRRFPFSPFSEETP